MLSNGIKNTCSLNNTSQIKMGFYFPTLKNIQVYKSNYFESLNDLSSLLQFYIGFSLYNIEGTTFRSL